MVTRNILIFAFTFIVSLVLTPVSMRLANKYKIIDVPEDGRRMHRRSIPCLGGLAIFVSVSLAILIFCIKYNNIPAIFIGGIVMFALGVIDDKVKLPAYVKFLVQLLVAIVMYAMGLRIQFIHNYFGEGILKFSTVGDFVITVLWIVGITNSINLIDGLDGLASGTVCINSLCLAYVISSDGQVMGRVAATMAFIAIAGACLGFLPFNFAPAKTFMGDGGALFLGFMIATLSTVGRLKASAAITMLVPVLVLALPLFDTIFAIIRRLFSKNPIMEADKKHLHHILMESGYGHKRAVLMLYGLSGILGVSAILLSKNLNVEALILFMVAVVYIYVFLTDPSHKPKKRAVRDEFEDWNRKGYTKK
ncbi:MAG: undecaprenyl/decaprenyl-phosphate alpha-N-acetylglucosaminyl 1-phosphate transferase [Firmicutes bacterium]|nr:undecaprenyl/decaprenyl-phosphate alpha-N-acetylglucosaminyl 1-phosphate transferase [Bacillota bacterium]